MGRGSRGRPFSYNRLPLLAQGWHFSCRFTCRRIDQTAKCHSCEGMSPLRKQGQEAVCCKRCWPMAYKLQPTAPAPASRGACPCESRDGTLAVGCLQLMPDGESRLLREREGKGLPKTSPQEKKYGAKILSGKILCLKNGFKT